MYLQNASTLLKYAFPAMSIWWSTNFSKEHTASIVSNDVLMEVNFFSETLVITYYTTGLNNAQDRNELLFRHDNLKSYHSLLGW